MGDEIDVVLREIIKENANLDSEEKVTEFIEKMKLNTKLQYDVWSETTL